MTPEELGTAVRAWDTTAVTGLLAAASEAERILCATLVRQLTTERLDGITRGAWMPALASVDDPRRHWREYRRKEAALGLAVLGTGRSARQATATLDMIDIEFERLAVTVLRQRPRPWLEQFCEPPLSSFRGAGLTWWRLVRALVRAGLVARPSSPFYITLMPAGLGDYRPDDRRSLRDVLLADPDLLNDEIFGLFTTEDAARELKWAEISAEASQTLKAQLAESQPPACADGGPSPERSWRVTLVRLAAEGYIDRDRLLDACLGAFFCDFPASQITWYVRLHQELAPDAGELAARSGRYLRLLAADAGTAVGLGQNAITTLLSSGRIDQADVAEASGAALARPEKKYAVAQLRLLDAVARQHPDVAERAVEAASAGFEHPLAEVQSQALDLAARHDRHVSPAVREKLRSAALSLSPSLRSRAEAVLGGSSSDSEPAPEPAAMAAAPSVPAGPPPVAGLGEFASTAAALAADPQNPLLAEQVIDAIARFAADRSAFTAALAPLTRHLEGGGVGTGEPPLRALTWILQGATQGNYLLEQLRAWPWGARVWRGGRRADSLTPRALFAERIWEACTRSADGEARHLLAYPDTGAGHVDPERVVAEVAAMEDAGTELWPADLTQTLLRLPRRADERVISAAARLRSAAGRALADVLRRGAVPDPMTELGHDSRGVLLVNTGVRGVAPVKMRVDPAAPVTGDLLPAIWELRDFDDHAWPARELLVWAHALPSHREIVAGHALQVMSVVDIDLGWRRPDVQFVAGLPDMQGPAGPAVVLTVAYSLFAHDPAHRAAAVEALIAFARHDPKAGIEDGGDSARDARGLDGAAVGRMLGEMNAVRAGRVADCLRSAAAGPATRPLVWQIASSAIPGLLRSGARDTHRLLAVAADLAAQLGVRAKIDGLADAAAAKGRSRLAEEARRLQALM